MKRISFIYATIFSLLAFSFFGCEEDVVKSDYEKEDASKLPTLNLEVTEVTFESGLASATVSINGDDNFSEKGFLVTTVEDFSEIEDVVAVEGDMFEASLALGGETTYFVKAYTVSVNGIATSNMVSFTTPIAPVFEDTYLFGTYTETDYDLSGEVEAVYEGAIEIAQVPGRYNQVYISNLWDGGEVIVGVVDFESKTISVSPQVIYVDATYGDCYIYALEIVDGAAAANMTIATIATYDEEGNITLGMWGARVSAGFFGRYSKSEFVKVN